LGRIARSHLVALALVARHARRDEVEPRVLPALGHGHDVVEREVAAAAG
jgi:hypothetical protein